MKAGRGGLPEGSRRQPTIWTHSNLYNLRRIPAVDSADRHIFNNQKLQYLKPATDTVSDPLFRDGEPFFVARAKF